MGLRSYFDCCLFYLLNGSHALATRFKTRLFNCHNSNSLMEYANRALDLLEESQRGTVVLLGSVNSKQL